MANDFDFRIDVQLNGNVEKKLEQAAQKAMKQVAATLDGRFTDALKRKVWDWDLPQRTSKGSPREITLDGGLAASKEFRLSGLSAEWKWTTKYAAAVHDGARIHPWGNRDVTVTLPARPWTTAVLKGGTSANSNGIEVYDFSTELSRLIAKNFKP